MTDVSNVVDDILEHHGVKGMKWGVRRDRPHEVTLRDLKRGVKTSGGYRHPVHTDAVVARTIGQKSRGSGVKALSNEELRIYANRLQLEQNVKRLDFNDRHPAKRFVLNVLGQSGRDAVNREANLATKKLGRKAIKLAMATA